MQFLAQMKRVLAVNVLLVLWLCHAEAAATSNEISPRQIVYEMDIDNLIDENIETIRKVAWELDPMELDDVNFPLTSHIFMTLYTGWAQNIERLQRAGKCRMRYADKKFNIDLNLGWEDIVFDYRYLIRILLAKRQGDLHGQMTKLNVHIALEIDFHNYHITLKALDLQEKGQLNISLEGHLLDYVYNMVIKAVTNVFRTTTLNTIREKLQMMIMHRIDEVNLILGSKVNQRQFTFVDLTKSIDNHVYDTITDNRV